MRKLIRFVSKLLHRYQVTVRSDEDFSEKISFVFNYLKLSAVALFVFLLGVGASFFIWRYIYSNYYLTEYENEKNRQENRLSEMAHKIDELEHMNDAKDQFINTFRLYLGKYDSLPAEVNISNLAAPISVNTNSIEGEPLRASLGNSSMSEIYFLPPILGYGISRGFDYKTSHWGADIVAKEGEPILCIADGTVIFASWTEEAGYVIAVQHRNDITSFYKHNSVVLKNVGDMVLAGEAIAIIGNSGKHTSGPHLHFEIWHKGQALNPENYISFDK